MAVKTFEVDGVLYTQWVENTGVQRVPADRRLSCEDARRLNGKEQALTVAFQERLLEAQVQREQLMADDHRDSCVLYLGDEE